MHHDSVVYKCPLLKPIQMSFKHQQTTGTTGTTAKNVFKLKKVSKLKRLLKKTHEKR